MDPNVWPGRGSDDADFRVLDVIRVGGKYRLKEKIRSGSFVVSSSINHLCDLLNMP
jgi:hypothetical protein